MTKIKRNRTKYQKEYRKRPEVMVRKRIQNKLWIREWRKNNPEKNKENRKKHYERRGKEQMRIWINNTINGRYKTYKDNCKRSQRPFKISKDYFAIFWKRPCEYCGGEIKTIGLDRKDNTKGYIKENVVSCCKICNAMKSKLSKKEFLKQVKKIYKNKKIKK